MSRIGKKPVSIPKGVTVSAAAGSVTVKGPKGTLTLPLPASVKVESDASTIRVTRTGESKLDRSCHGSIRAVLENHVKGVVTPFQKVLDIQGVGYQCSMKGKKLALKAGFANEILLDVPAGLQLDLPSNTRVIVSGADRQLVGLFAAKIRATRPPEPYNGKGIKYDGERIERKAGKSFTSGG
jgi:large subunit ribosomal protein L6